MVRFVAVVAFPTRSTVTPFSLSQARPPWPTQTRALPPASLARLLDDQTWKEARRPSRLLLSLLCRPADRWRSNVDPSRTGHAGVIVFSESTPVSTPAATFAPSWHWDCRGGGGGSKCQLLPSASTPVSSCAVPPLRLRGDVRLCVWVGRHHYWAAGPLGLGFPLSLYM
jgi:hypothetical protein